MKIIHIIAKVVLSLIFIMPIFGLLGLFPAPTRDLYNTDSAFAFIQFMTESAVYINYMMVGVFIVSLVALWTKREALAALLVSPITANIVGFHMFLDGGLFKSGAILALVLLVINIYLLYVNRDVLQILLNKKSI